MACYAILGATGNCGSALIQTLLQHPTARINAFCRNKAKLLSQVPDYKKLTRLEIFEGSIQDVHVLAKCLRGCRAVFLVISTNDNIPGCDLSQSAASSLLSVVKDLRCEDGYVPKVVLLSSCTIDDYLSRHTPYILRQILLLSASHVYNDLRKTEIMLRAQQHWLTTIYMKPGALSLDGQRGHALSFTDEDSPVSYLDLAAAMIEAADDEGGRYDHQNVSVVAPNGKAKFPAGTPMCIVVGLLRHFFPFLHPYLPTNMGPR
nr:monoogygenase tpcg [Quercus suber]